MTARADILDERESLRRPLTASLCLHVAVFAVVIGVPLIRHLGKHEPWGDPSGGGQGAIAVNVVNRIPLPGRSGPLNPIANDTRSVVPSPPPEAKQRRAAREPDADAIPIKSKGATRRAAQSASDNKWRAQQRDLPNQMYSASGQGLVSQMVGQTGAGGIGFGNSVFGRRFGNYASVLRDAVARKWSTSDVDPRVRSAPPVVVTFTILRNGQVKNVRVIQRSGMPLLDSSAERAVYDAAPFPPLPAEYEGSEANIEFTFQLSR